MEQRTRPVLPAGKAQLGRHGPVDLGIVQFRLCRNNFRG